MDKMCEMNFDWLTVSYVDKRAFNGDVDEQLSAAIDNVLHTLHLGDIWKNFVFVGRSRFYPLIMRYNDISVKICAADRLDKQGICVEFTGNGLAFYQAHLIKKKENLRRVMQAWRSLAYNGIFTRFTRIDIAKDEKRINGDKPNLTLRKIRCAVNNGEVRSRFLVERGNHTRKLEIHDDFSFKGGEDNGYTISFGKRSSLIYCRFYDKLLEQKSKGLPVDDGLTSWMRCEFEFHNSRAMAVANAYCDKPEKEFSQYVAEVFNNYICFINKDDTNKSRCSSKRWWAAFIGTVERSSLAIPKYKPVTFRSVSEWLQHSVFPTLNIYLKCVGLKRFLAMLKKCDDNDKTPKQIQLEQDYIEEFINCANNKKAVTSACNNLALDAYLFTSVLSIDELTKEFEKEYKRYHTVNGNGFEPFSEVDEGVQLYLSRCYDYSGEFDGLRLV